VQCIFLQEILQLHISGPALLATKDCVPGRTTVLPASCCGFLQVAAVSCKLQTFLQAASNLSVHASVCCLQRLQPTWGLRVA
jgi:hypothetical protein